MPAGAARGFRRRRPRWPAGTPAPARPGCRGRARRRRPIPPSGSAVRRAHGQPGARDEVRHRREPLGMARRDHQPRAPGALGAGRRTPRAPPPLRPSTVLPATHSGRGSRPPGPARGAARAASPARRSASYLRLPVTWTRSGGRAHLQHPRAMRVALHQEEVDLGQHVAQQRPRPAVARERARRDAPVDHGDARAAPPRVVDEVRPDLGLHQHEEGRVRARSRTRRTGPAKSKGAKNTPSAPRTLSRATALSGERGRGHEHAMAGESRLQRLDEDPRRQHLAHGDGVDPDRRPSGRRHVVGQAPHAVGRACAGTSPCRGPSTGRKGRRRRSATARRTL